MRRSGLIILHLWMVNICFSQLSFTVTSSSGSFSLSCRQTIITLYASSNFSQNVTFLWSTPSQGTLNTNSISIGNDPGTYTITASSGSYIATQTVAVTIDKTLPTVSVAASGSIITCKQPSVTLTAKANPTHVTYSWIEPGAGLGCSSSLCVMFSPGNYAVIVTDELNGCVDTAEISIIDKMQFPLLATSGLFTLACPNGTVDLIPSMISPTAGLSFSWELPPGAGTGPVNEFHLNTNAPGSYIFTATDTLSGCSSRTELLVFACVGVIEDALNDMKIYPNPTQGIIKVEKLPSRGSLFQVISTNGEILLEIRSDQSSATIHLEGLADGSYYLLITTEKGRRGVRITKN